jgi:nitrate reductase delta subunit
LDTVEELLDHMSGPQAELLGHTVAALRACDPMTAATEYVETFDMRRRCTMYLTYWTAGDTRNRGREMLVFAGAYRDAGVEPPRKEAPDHLPVVLEFAATVDPEVGRRLLTEHRVPIDVLHAALADAQSPYQHAVAAVCETLPAATDQEVRRAERLAKAGPPAEAVGLQPFTLTVPPKRSERG